MPRDAVPGRLGMLLTLFLCMVNTLNNACNNSPKAPGGPTAMIRWLIVCLLFMLFSLVEYAWILAFYQESKKMESYDSETKKHSKSLLGENIEVKSNTAIRSKKWTPKRIDQAALLVLPVLFTVIIILFWTVLYKI